MKKNTAELTRGIPKHLKKVVLLERKKHHPHIHEVHIKHGISKKTLFYMKEYGPHSHLISTILKESFFVVALAATMSSVGGIGLQTIHEKLFAIIPLLILIPAMNGFMGNLGIILSSKFTTLLYMEKDRTERNAKMHSLARTVYSVAAIISVYMAVLSCTVAYLKGHLFGIELCLKIIGISVGMAMLMTTVLFAIVAGLGIWIFRKQEDPNNFLIPITTSVADLCCMLVFTAFVMSIF